MILKTRIAPTPSGFLHIGNILSFSITAFLARQKNGEILLRIDDMDASRTRPEYLMDIFETLRFLNIPWNAGPRNPEELKTTFSQWKRLPLYDDALDKLRENGLVYACDCSRSQLAATAPGYPGTCRHRSLSLDTPGVAWRLRTDGSIRDFIVKKKDGFPAYQLCSVVDDDYFGINFVVRGEDLLDSTKAQLFLSSRLPGSRFRNNEIFHHQLIKDEQGRKLSKSAGATSIQYMRGRGFSSEKIYMEIARAAGVSEEVYNYETLAEASLRQPGFLKQ